MLKKIFIGLAALVVVAGVSFALLFNSSFKKYQTKSKEGLLKINLMQVYTAAKMYEAENGKYPVTGEQVEGMESMGDVTIIYTGDGEKFLATATFENMKMTIDQDKVLRYENGQEIK
jgi:uncharacterized protein YpmB